MKQLLLVSIDPELADLALENDALSGDDSFERAPPIAARWETAILKGFPLLAARALSVRVLDADAAPFYSGVIAGARSRVIAAARKVARAGDPRDRGRECVVLEREIKGLDLALAGEIPE